ncbi:hypothetical protein LIER_12035 [Lithospermum erythrorhizon]|uniref:Uncharacterized protein n=1 Tax=Lithospermum erythrorhizon TaxID=34254 RepID=A0AAV3PQS8_LITER
MLAALENIFIRLTLWMRWRQPHHLSLLQDAHSSDISQSLRNRGWLTQVTRRLTTDPADHRYLDRGGVPRLREPLLPCMLYSVLALFALWRTDSRCWSMLWQRLMRRFGCTGGGLALPGLTCFFE